MFFRDESRRYDARYERFLRPSVFVSAKGFYQYEML